MLSPTLPKKSSTLTKRIKDNHWNNNGAELRNIIDRNWNTLTYLSNISKDRNTFVHSFSELPDIIDYGKNHHIAPFNIAWSTTGLLRTKLIKD